MCRIAAVFVLIIVSYVLGVSSDKNATALEVKCRMESKTLQSYRKEVNKCFSDIVNYYNYTLHNITSDNTTLPGLPRTCQTISNFNESLASYYTNVTIECGTKITAHREQLLGILEFSLNNTHLPGLDIDCVKRLELNISKCVNDTVGFLKISPNHTHSSWYQKIKLSYDLTTCTNAKRLQNCTLNVLDSCEPTYNYVESLFNFSAKYCPPPMPQPTIPPKSLPISLVLGICGGAVGVTALIIIIAVVKYKKRMNLAA